MYVQKGGRSKLRLDYVTKVLQQWGLSDSISITRRLVRENKIKAGFLGKAGASDKRSGQYVLERDLYKFICERIPGAERIFSLMEPVKEQYLIQKDEEFQETKETKSVKKSPKGKQTTIDEFAK